MILYFAKIQGATPLLIRGFEAGFGQDDVVKKRIATRYGTPREQAEKLLYIADDGKIWIPTSWFKGAITACSSEYKLPGSRKSLKSVIGGVVVTPNETTFFTEGYTAKDVEVDSRPAVVQRARIMRHRPRLEKWSVGITLQIDDEIVPPETIHDLLVDAGRRAGVGDYRPNRGGPFGKFKVTEWKPL